MTRTITAEHQRWLGAELEQWQGEGLIDEVTAQTIAGRYQVVSRKKAGLSRLLLAVGGAFVGIGVIWLVAANLDSMSPTVRFIGVLMLWIAALVSAERLASRPGHRHGSPVVGSARLLATLLLGGVIFQAAQSLQVPAFEPRLVGYWALGAFLHAYLMRAVMPLVVGIATGTIWLLTATLAIQASGLGAVLALAGAALLATALAHLHDGTPTAPAFTVIWREVGAAYALVALFVSAIPPVTAEGFTWKLSLVLILTGAGIALAVTVARRRTGLGEIAGALGIGVLSVLLVLWEAGQDSDRVDFSSWAHAGLAVTAYVAAALWVAWLGIVHDSARLTWIATGALVVFTTFQSFAVFARIIEGAWLFVVLGLVLAGSGYLFDKAQRQLRRELEPSVAAGNEGVQS